MKKFVWDTSALLNIKEPDANGYSPGHSLFKDLVDGWIPGPYQNIYPALAAFEVSASVSRMHRDQRPILRDFYILHENAIIYPVDDLLIQRTAQLTSQEGFIQLRGADLVFACIAHLEGAYLVTLDKGFYGRFGLRKGHRFKCESVFAGVSKDVQPVKPPKLGR